MRLFSSRPSSSYLTIIEQLQRGQYKLEIPARPNQEEKQVFEALQSLARTLVERDRLNQQVQRITAHLISGWLLEDVLESLEKDFRDLIPFNRIGLALLEKDGEVVRSAWQKSDRTVLRLVKGYSAPLAGSSLAAILQTGTPRIINNLKTYLRQHPQSASTRLIIEEGLLSSLTCPLIANGVPVGFLFFSSAQSNFYHERHIEAYQRLTRPVSLLIEKSRHVTQLTEQKAALEQQNTELRRLNEIKNNFLGMAAHDLRNPVSYIQTTAELLHDYGETFSSGERLSLLQDIIRQTNHILGLLNDLLDVTEIETGKLMLHKRSLDLDLILSEAVTRHERLAAAKGTQVILKSAPPGVIQADPARLRQVLDNLLSNAVKYSPPSSKVEIWAEKTQRFWRVSVRDHGPGIAASEQKQLFQDFTRGSAQPTGGEKSVGLGLSISRRIVESHGGQIGITSEPGRGATFWFTIPLP